MSIIKPRMENQMGKNMEHDMETEIILEVP